MRNFVSALLASAATAAMSSASAAVLVPVPAAPNSTLTTVFAINDQNAIAGSYIGADDGIEHGFFGTLDGNYTSFDAGSGGTEARGLANNGDIVGFTNSQSGVTSDQPVFEMYDNGKIRVLAGIFGRAGGINSTDGRFAGTRWDFNNHQAVAFVGHKGKYRRDVRIPLVHQASTAEGINGADVVVGSFFRPPTHGFIGNGGSLVQVDYPSDQANGTTLNGLNDANQAVGQWTDSAGNTHSFLLDVATNTFTDITVSGAANVYAWGINNNGAVAVSSDAGSYILCAKAKQCPAGGAAVAAPTHQAKTFPEVHE